MYVYKYIYTCLFRHIPLNSTTSRLQSLDQTTGPEGPLDNSVNYWHLGYHIFLILEIK